MKSKSRIWVICLFISFILSGCTQYVRAQTEDADDDGYASAGGGQEVQVEDVEFTHYFPNNPFKTIVPGQVTDCLIGMKNRGLKNETYTVFGLTGLLVNPRNFSHVFQNLTRFQYVVTLNPHEEATLPYRLKVDLDPMDVGVVVLVDYYDSEEYYTRGLGFSDIVKIIAPITTFDLEALSVYLLLLAFVIGVGYFTYTTFLAQYLPKRAPTSSGKRRSTATRSSEVAGSSSGSPGGRSGENGGGVASPTASSESGKVNLDWIPDHLKNAASPKIKKRK